MKPRLVFAIALLSFMAASAATAAQSCQASTSGAAPTVVELYTSEGCSSCPPADRWLSTLKGRPGVLALAFHVDYWNKLGWVDRYATAEATARQYELARQAGRDGVYTPQVLANGRDWRDWPRLPASTAVAATTNEASRPPPGGPVAPSLTLSRDGDTVTAAVAGHSGNGLLAGYWAVLEDGHESKVRAGENAGETLRHDHVVRLYRPVAAWANGAGHRTQLQVSRGVPETPRRVVFVVTDAATSRPLQALALSC